MDSPKEPAKPPEDPIEYLCGILKDRPSLTQALLEERRRDLQHEERDFIRSRAGYAVTIRWSEEDQAYVADVPELPGCVADGAKYQDMLRNVESAIHGWIETATELGRPIPPPTRRPKL